MKKRKHLKVIDITRKRSARPTTTANDKECPMRVWLINNKYLGVRKTRR